METGHGEWGARKAVAVMETRLSSMLNTEADAPEITNHTSSREETMSATNELNHDTPAMEGTQQQNESQPKVSRNRMQNVAQKINQLRVMAKEGRTREVICKELGINFGQFDTLRSKLFDMDKTYYDIPCETAERSCKVGKGGIHISSDRLLAMAADRIFDEGTPISIRLDGDRLLIERADAKTSAASPDVPSSIEEFMDDLAEGIRPQSDLEAEVN